MKPEKNKVHQIENPVKADKQNKTKYIKLKKNPVNLSVFWLIGPSDGRRSVATLHRHSHSSDWLPIRIDWKSVSPFFVHLLRPIEHVGKTNQFESIFGCFRISLFSKKKTRRRGPIKRLAFLSPFHSSAAPLGGPWWPRPWNAIGPTWPANRNSTPPCTVREKNPVKKNPVNAFQNTLQQTATKQFENPVKSNKKNQ